MDETSTTQTQSSETTEPVSDNLIGDVTPQNQETYWYESIQDPALREHPEIQNHKDIESFAKTHVNLQKMIGDKRIVAPKENWGETEYNEFYNQLGRPEKPDEYGFDLGDVKPEQIGISEEDISQWQNLAHQLGLPKSKGKQLFGAFAEREANFIANQEKEKADTLERNIKELDESFGDKKDYKVDLARTALEKFGNKDISEHLQEKGLLADAKFIKFLSGLGEQTLDDSALFRAVNGNGSSNPVNTVATADRRINEIKNDPELMSAVYDSNHPRHNELSKEYKSLRDVKLKYELEQARKRG
jgi:hypothetical protein